MLLSHARVHAVVRHPAALSLLVLIVLGLIAVTAGRTYRQYAVPSRTFDWNLRGMSDFHNGTYYPTLAFANGDNPYAAAVRNDYPMARQSPVYSPVVFLLHLPFVFLPLPAADVAFFIYSTILLMLLAWLAIVWTQPSEIRQPHRVANLSLWLLMSAILLISRPGHITLFTGYFTLELVLGTLLALQYSRSRPWISGLGILLASGKPTYVIPLVILMLAQKRWRAIAWGLGFSFVAGMAGLIWLASFEGWQHVLNGIREGQEGLHQDPTELPFHSWTRVDTLGLVAKVLSWAPGDAVYLGTMILMILSITPWLWKRASANMPNRQGINSIDACVMLLMLTISIYHHSYDVLVLVPVIAACLLSTRDRIPLSPTFRWLTVLLCATTFFNLLSTQSLRDRMGWDSHDAVWQAITMINGIALLLAMLILLLSSSATSYRGSATTIGSVDS